MVEPTSLAAIGALIISAITIVFQAVKFVQELRERAARAADQATKSEAERDSVVVKSAEGTLLMMRGMLEMTRASESELKQDNRVLQSRVSDLEIEVKHLKSNNQELLEQLHREREERAKEQSAMEDRIRRMAQEYQAQLTALSQRTTNLEGQNDQRTNPGG